MTHDMPTTLVALLLRLQLLLWLLLLLNYNAVSAGTMIVATTGGRRDNAVTLEIVHNFSSPLEAAREFFAFDDHNTLLFFVADAPRGGYGRELWVFNGTDTFVIDLKQGNDTHIYEPWPTGFVVYHDRLYFGGASPFSSDPQAGLYTTDGTAEGTHLVEQMQLPGPLHYEEMNGDLYFSAYGRGSDPEGLYKLTMDDSSSSPTDTTTPTVQLVKAFSYLVVQNQRGKPGNLAVFDGKLFFTSWDEAHGTEVWVSNGTEQGTFVIDINKGASTSLPTLYVEFNDALYFATVKCWAWSDCEFLDPGDGLYRTDGTTEGTQLVERIKFSYQREFVELQDELYFNAAGMNGSSVVGLYKLSRAGTVQLVKEFATLPKNLFPFRTKLFFYADGGEHDEAVWV
jgi:ELWxxDGT repeat protein